MATSNSLGRSPRTSITHAFILALLALLLVARDARAQSAAWSLPLHLSTPGVTASFPHIIADAAGGTHVVWSSTDDRFDVVMYASQPPVTQGEAAAPWSAPVDIVANLHNPGQYYVARPVLTVDAAWQLHLGVHAPGDQLQLANAPLATALNPQTWQVSDLAGAGYHAIPLANGTTMHLVYTQHANGAGCEFCLRLYYVQSTDGGMTWTDAVDVGRRQDRGAAKPALRVGRGGVLHMVWESGLDGDRGYVAGIARVMYAASFDNGANWSTPLELDAIPADITDETTGARNVTIGQAGDGTLVAAWWNMPEDQPFYRTSSDDGRTWSSVQPIPSAWGVGGLSYTRQDTYSMATDSAGAVHLLMVGRLDAEDSTLALLHLTYNGGWSAPQAIASYTADLPEWPQAAIGLGNQLHVVWHVRPGVLTNPMSDASWEVWEADTTLASPAIAPAAPAQVPTPLPADATADATPQPTVAPEPTQPVVIDRIPPAAPASLQALMSENDDVLLLALALVPAALLVGIWLYAQRRRRRPT